MRGGQPLRNLVPDLVQNYDRNRGCDSSDIWVGAHLVSELVGTIQNFVTVTNDCPGYCLLNHYNNIEVVKISLRYSVDIVLDFYADRGEDKFDCHFMNISDLMIMHRSLFGNREIYVYSLQVQSFCINHRAAKMFEPNIYCDSVLS